MTNIVVKVGGHALDSLRPNAALLAELAHDIKALNAGGSKTALVHGGGPQIGELLDTAGVASRFVEGLRVTDTVTMMYVAMALQHVNLLITAGLAHNGLSSVGIGGGDGGLFNSTSLGEPWKRAGATPVVRTDIVRTLWGDAFTPVISPFALDREGELLNCNADASAGALAGALDADVLVMLSDIDQLRSDVDDPASALATVNSGDVEELLRSGAAREGMRPKLTAALDALHAGATRIIIANGKRPHALRDALEGRIPTTEVVQ
ncbi:MAG: acetylglutamate kinase [Acidobacteria bacterium]|nr:acetylglutamate kinase [Acidobacteriota bacterium]